MGILDAPVGPSLKGLTASYFTAARNKLDRGLESVVLAVVGDSTGSGNTTGAIRWAWNFANKLAVAYPAYTVNFRPWNATTNVYDTTIVIQTGTGTGNAGGPFVLDFYNGSASGKDPSYSQGLVSTVLPVIPDLVIINHGHNISANPDITTQQAYYALVRDILRYIAPSVPIVCMGQNPRTSPAANITTHQQRMTRLQELCAQEGWGFVNITQVFYDQPNWTSLINNTDGIHPTDAGSVVWSNAVWSLWQQSGEYARPHAVQPRADRLWIPAAAFLPALIVGANPTGPVVLNSFLPVISYGKQAGVMGASTTAHVPSAWRALNLWVYWTTADGVAGNVAWQIDMTYISRIGLDTGSAANATALAMNTGSSPVTGAAPGVAYGQSHTLVQANTGYGAAWASGIPAVPRNHIIRVGRSGANAGDTYAGTAHMYGLLIERAA